MKRTILSLLGLLAVCSFATQAMAWTVVETFDEGAPTATWEGDLESMNLDFSGNNLAYSSATGNAQSIYVALPSMPASGQVTIAFDYFLPDGMGVKNEAGFGVADTAKLELTGWNRLGARNRYQAAHDYPQFMVKAGAWSTDVLGDTMLGTWYNVWVVYDLDAGTQTVYAKPASHPMSALVGPTTNDLTETYTAIEYFVLGGGGSGDPENPAVGAVIDNIYMDTAENLSMTPTGIDATWQVVDTFDGGAPNATWEGNLENMNLDFSDNNLKYSSATGNAESIYATLPEMPSDGMVTITFDYYLPDGGVKNEAGFGVADEEKLGNSGWGRVGARNRYQAAADHPQRLVKAGDWGNDLLKPTELGTWYNIWVVYDLALGTQTFYAKKAADAPGMWIEPTSHEMTEMYSALGYFVLGAGGSGDAENPAVGAVIDNIYMAAGMNLSLSPTAQSNRWMLVDDFDDGTVGDGWMGDTAEMTLDESEGNLLYASATGNAQSVYAALPMAASEGTVTIAFDYYLPDTGEKNEVGFGVADEAKLSETGWNRVGARNRYQAAANYPQIVVKAGAWSTDVLGETMLGTWYNVWVVYDLDAGTQTVYAKPITASMDALFGPTTNDLTETYTAIEYFVLGGGGTGTENPPAGARIDNLYMSPGSVVELTPGSMVVTSPFADATDLGDGWIESPWFDTLNITFLDLVAGGWIFHLEHGWLYVAPGLSVDAVYLYDLALEDWLFTNVASYPSLYSFLFPGWLFYNGLDDDGNRVFIVLADGTVLPPVPPSGG